MADGGQGHGPGAAAVRSRDAIPGGTRPASAVQEVLFTDGTWDVVEEVAQAPQRGGGWRGLVRWYETGERHTQHETWFVHDPARFRDPRGE